MAPLTEQLNRIRRAVTVLTAPPPAPGSAQTGTRILADHKLTVTKYAAPDSEGAPVVLIPPLAAPAASFDLREGQSLLEFLVDRGYRVYLADYGEITFGDRNLGFEDWIDRIVPSAISAAANDSQETVQVVGWSLGGTICLLTASAHPDLPIASLTAIATPVDYSLVAAIAPLRRIAQVTGGRLVGSANRFMGGIPPWMVRGSFRLTAIERELTKPWFVLRHADQPDKIDQLKSTDGFTAAMPAYPGRLFNQLWFRLMLGNELAAGTVHIAGRTIEISRIDVPVLAVGGLTDVIAAIPVVQAITKILTGAPSLRFETAPGGHLGVLTGPGARETTWRYLDEHLTTFRARQDN